MKTHRVSVLVPVYKTDPKYLREAIDSILAQTFADFELLLLDDCPENPRKSVVDEFKDPRIVYVSNDRNLGISGARNRLLSMAKGEYLAIFDHDDISHADRLEKEVAYLDAHRECGVVSSWTYEIPSGKVVRLPETDAMIRLSLMSGCAVSHSAALLRASVLRDNGIRYEAEFSPGEDYMLWLRLLAHTEFYNIQEPLIDYRKHEGNTSNLQDERMWRMTIAMRAWAWARYPELYVAQDRAAATLGTRVFKIMLLGLLILKIETHGVSTTVRLFGRLRILTIKSMGRELLWGF